MAVSNLSPFQQFLSQRFPGKNAKITPQQFEQAALQFWGPMPIPPGSQVISQSASEARYVDAEGYEHVLRRSLDGRDPNAGKVQDLTSRPNVLPVKTPQGFDQDMGSLRALSAKLQLPPELANLDPQTAAQFDAILQAQQAQNEQQIAQQQGQLLAGLFGNRVNQSSIATGAGARFAEGAGRLRQQTSADDATRRLQARLGLSEQGQRDRALALEGLSRALGANLDLTGQQTQREIAGSQIGFGREELAERGRQFNLGFEIDQQRADLLKKQIEQEMLLNKINTGLSLVGTIAGGIGGGLAGASKGVGGVLGGVGGGMRR